MQIKCSFISIFKKVAYNHYKEKYRTRKHTEVEYVTEIIKFLRNSIYWRRFGILGRYLNKKHNEYIRLNIYKKVYELVLKKYLKINPSSLKYLSSDTTFIANKMCAKFTKKNKR